jgi:succinate dehydrogenase / fumarate reductase, flavoprotein subunit
VGRLRALRRRRDQPGSPRNHATNIPGLYACGECDYAYHGANRLGANSLLSASYSGRVAGEAVVSYLKGLAVGRASMTRDAVEAETDRQQAINAELMGADGPDNPYRIQKDLGLLMTAKVGVVRSNPELATALGDLEILQERLGNASLGESSTWVNQSLAFARQLRDMIELARVVTQGALARDECRGAHYKPAFQIRIPEGKFGGDPEFEAYRARWHANNAQWLKTTIAEHTPDGPRLSYQEVDLSVYPPTEPRDYR